MTPYAEVIGDPIAQSKSPVIHRFWLDQLGIAGDYRACLVPPARLATHLAERRGDPVWRGCNVTMPHKVAVMTLVDRLDPVAERVGAVNTIVAQDGLLTGYNTDVDGIREALTEPAARAAAHSNGSANHVQIIGAGGAARAAAVAARWIGDMAFFNRDPAGAARLATSVGLPAWFGKGLDALGPTLSDGDTDQRYGHVVINASPMGMHGKPAVPIDLTRYRADTVVFDMVYAPLETPLLHQARARGLRTIDGLAMLIGQAAAAFALFFGVAPPREADGVLRELLL